MSQHVSFDNYGQPRDSEITAPSGLPPGAEYMLHPVLPIDRDGFLEMIHAIDDFIVSVTEIVSSMGTGAWFDELVRQGIWQAVCQRCGEAEGTETVQMGDVDYGLCVLCRIVANL